MFLTGIDFPHPPEKQENKNFKHNIILTEPYEKRITLHSPKVAKGIVGLGSRDRFLFKAGVEEIPLDISSADRGPSVKNVGSSSSDLPEIEHEKGAESIMSRITKFIEEMVRSECELIGKTREDIYSVSTGGEQKSAKMFHGIKRGILTGLEHLLCPMHVRVRLMDLGVSTKRARTMAELYDRNVYQRLRLAV